MATGQVPLRLRIQWRLREAARRWIMSTTVLLIAGIALSATSRFVLDVMQWRSSAHIARSVLADRQRSDSQHVDAIVVLQRDALTSIEMLRVAACENDAAAQHARNALRAIAEASR